MESQALLQVASKNAGRIELLEARQNTLDPVRAASEEPRHAIETGAKISILVKQIEKMQGDDPVALVAKIGPDLLKQMIAEGTQPRCGLLEPGTARRIEASVATAPGLGLATQIHRPVAVLAPFRLPMFGRVGSEFARKHLRYSRRGHTLSAADIVALCVFPEVSLAPLQQFDPSGVFARDLKECLALQLRERNRFDPAMQALLDNLPLVAARNIPALVRVCNVDAVDVHEMIREIQSLDPQPGLAFDPPLAQPVVPDILMRAQPKGGWIVELNGETLPRVLVNKSYYAQVCRATRHKAEKDYLIERLHAANWLVKSLHQRAITILKVAAEIVRQQDAFFRRGVPSLRPLILRDIADAIGMHESTISRVTSNKYMATPRGLYELKYFFTSAIPASGGNGAHSAEAVRHRIRALISGEPPDGTFSDERIVELLHYEGVDIKRRTVAKYREAMRIPSSVRRRREKLLAPGSAR